MSAARILATFALGIAVLFAGVCLAWGILSDVIAERSLGPDLRIPACATDDDPGPCYWDADTRGNGQGESFIVLDGVLYTPEVAR